MSDLQIFNSEQFGKIRAVEVDGQPWFCLADVCRPLGLQAYKCRSRLKQEGILTRDTPTNSGVQGMLWVNEGNLYRAIFQSKKPEAEAFTDWVTEEVLPALRRTGAYVAPSAPAQLLVDTEKRMDEVQGQTRALEAKVDTAMKALSRPAEDHWRSDMDKAIKNLNADMGWSLPKLRGKLFAELEHTVNCDLNARTRRLRERKKRAGMRAKEANELGKLDAIAADKQLWAIFEGIVRNYQAQVVPTGEAAE